MAEERHLHGLEKPAGQLMERRATARFKAQLRLSISTERGRGSLAVSSANVCDVSCGGALVVSRLWLTPFQEVMLAIPTGSRSQADGLPEAFLGPATVVRVQKCNESKNLVGLRFGSAIQQNMQFQDFIDSLHDC